MDADQPLKVLFRTRPRDLLPLTGDWGARVLSAGVLQVPEARRDVDLVLLLERRGERYVRHVEFEARYRRNLALRCFEYATRLVVRLRQSVLTTVVFLRSGPRDLAASSRPPPGERRVPRVGRAARGPDEGDVPRAAAGRATSRSPATMPL
jgi:hypothetical protein